MLELINKIAVKNYVPPDPVKLLAADFAARQAKVMESIAAPRINAVKTDLLTSQALTGLIANNTVIGSQFKFGNVKSLLDSIDLGEIDIEEVDEDDDPWELSGVVEEEFEHLPEEVRETLSDRQRMVIRKTLQALLTLELIFVLLVVYGEIPGLPDQGGWIAVVVTMLTDVRRIPEKLVDWADSDT